MRSKIGIGVLLSGILALAILISSTKAEEEIENMLENPDFELGIEGWTIGSLADGAAGQLSIDKKEKAIVGETFCVKIDGVGNDGWEPEVHSPQFEVEVGKTYTCSFWAKTEPDTKRSLTVKFEQLDTWTGPSETFTITDEWAEYHLSPVMTMGSPPNVVLHLAFNFVKDDVWFSHFRVYEGEYVEEDIEGLQKISVAPMGRLAIAWGQIKNR